MRKRISATAFAWLWAASMVPSPRSPCWTLNPRTGTRRRDALGRPRLQGTYSNAFEGGTPMERPQEFEGRRNEDV